MNAVAPRPEISTSAIGLTAGNGSKIAPQNLGEVVRFAEVMCKADIALPQHLRGNAGACMAVALQALEWEMSPFAVASKSYSVSGRIAYEAQLIAAVVNTRSGIKGRLRYEFIGEGNDLSCKVTGVLDGEECTYESPPFSAITPKNSPLWKTDPRQQLAYYGARSWARRHCPEVILGVYDRDEMEGRGPDNARDITPSQLSVMQRLQARQQEPQETREGFDADFVQRETENLSAASPDLIDEPSEASPRTDVESGTDQSLADSSALDNSDDQADMPMDDLPAAQKAQLTDDDYGWLMDTARILWAATELDKHDILENQFRGVKQTIPAFVSDAAMGLGTNILDTCRKVCAGKLDQKIALKIVANAAGCSEKDITS